MKAAAERHQRQTAVVVMEAVTLVVDPAQIQVV
jgi:hypothetical protein